MQIYCGNNANYKGLISGTHYVGTNYQCLKKGIGKGKNLPYDSKYLNQYTPIDARKFYCGNSNVLPNNYFADGSPSKCLSIGIGVGKAQRASMGPAAYMYFVRYILPYLLFIIFSGIFFIVIYFTKPNFFYTKDENKKRILDLKKFLPYFIIFMLLVIISIYFFWKKIVLKRI